MFESVTALRDSIVSVGNYPQEYIEKMFHPVPDMDSVKDRAAYLIEKAKGKFVLDIGCTGKVSQEIRKVARQYRGVDVVSGPDVDVVDLDAEPNKMTVYDGVEMVIASEVLEHLCNPGNFLVALKEKYPGVPVIFTAPNAGAYVVKGGNEVVHKDHVAWYSYTTLKRLLDRHGFVIKASAWYNGQPHKAEGIIFVAVG